MISLIVSMIGGVLAPVVTLIIGTSVSVAFGVAVLAAFAVFVALGVATISFYFRVQSLLEVIFPTPADGTGQATDARR